MSYKIAPPRNLTLDIAGKIIYKPGPWGTNRPVRNWADASLWAYELTTKNRYFLGNEVTDGDGKFKFTAHANQIPANLPQVPIIQQGRVEFRLELTESYTNDEEVLILDNLQWGQAQTHDLGQIRVKWEPAVLTLASVGPIDFSDTRTLARHLMKLIDFVSSSSKIPNHPFKMSLLREPSENNEFTPVQKLFKQLAPGKLPADFPARVCFEVNKIPSFHSTSKHPADKIKDFLHKISVLGIKKLEKESTLNSLIVALSNALNQRVVNPVWEEAADMAAVCILLFAAGVMAKNHTAKPWTRLGLHTFSDMPMRDYHKVEVSISY